MSDARRRRFRHPILLGIGYALWIVLLCWGGLKFFWWWRFSVRVTQAPGPEAVWHLFYPELFRSGALDANLSPADGFYDVLLLGGSVLEQTAPKLEQALQVELAGRLRLFNLARAAHTSRDSFLKHSRLTNRHFNLVIDYDGVNDSRVNCCPDDVFRADYTHMAWYRGFERRLASGRISLSDVVTRSLREGQSLGPEDGEWRRFGVHVKTANSFRNNIESIVKAAEDRRCPVVLMTSAYYIAPNYSDEAFEAKQLDYGPGQHAIAIRLWGTPQGVKSAIDAHNAVVRELARRHKNVIFVDQMRMVPANGRHFSDVCHLTDQGIDVFVHNVMDAIRGELERWKRKQAENSSSATAPP